MAITLQADVNATDTLWHVADPGAYLATALLPVVAQIGSEFVEINGLGRHGQVLKVSVGRGLWNTSRATHSAGATVTPVQLVVQTDAPTAPPPATAGAPQLVTIQSADLDTTTPDFINPGAGNGPELFTIPAGSHATLRLFTTTAFDSQGEIYAFAGESTDGALKTVGHWAAAGTNKNAWVAVETIPLGADLSLTAVVTSDIATASGNDWATAGAQTALVSAIHQGFAYASGLRAAQVAFTALQDAVVTLVMFPNGADPTTGAVTIECEIATPA